MPTHVAFSPILRTLPVGLILDVLLTSQEPHMEADKRDQFPLRFFCFEAI
jgi:hypothetical protein